MLRPKEELFEPEKDPYERNNLAGKEEYLKIQQQLAKALEESMNKYGDPGAILDTRKAFNAQRQGNHFQIKTAE
jgi:hypothetical protein